MVGKVQRFATYRNSSMFRLFSVLVGKGGIIRAIQPTLAFETDVEVVFCTYVYSEKVPRM